MAKFLKKNSTYTIGVHPQYNADKEKEHICIFEAKKNLFIIQEKGIKWLVMTLCL